MRIWFWAWVLVAVVVAVVAALTRDRYGAPWAVGATVAAALEAARVGPAWQWAAFLLVSAAISVTANRVRYAGRHARSRSEKPGPGRHSPGGREKP